MTHPARINRLLNTLEMRRRAVRMESMPWSVQLEVTTKCNLACIMCARDKYHGRGSHLEDDILEPVLRDLVPIAQDIIVSSFGEPLLYPGIGRLFGEIDPASGLKLGFFTNFLLLDEEMAEHIVDSGVAYINASIDGASKETYETIRRGGQWETLIEKIELFERVRARKGAKLPVVNLCVVGSTLNVDEAADFVDLAKRHGFASVKYNPNMYVDDEEMDHLSLVHEQAKTVRRFREAHRRAVELDVHTNFHRKPFKIDLPKEPVPRRGDVSALVYALNSVKRLWRHGIGWRVENTWLQSGGQPGAFVHLGAIKARDKAIDAIPVVGSLRRKVPIPHTIPNDAPPKSCGNPWTHVHIKSDGLVYPCCFSDEVMGDLRTQSIGDIWNGEKYQDLRRSMKTREYWASCRRASCNWVEGAHSSIYGAEIAVLRPVTTIDGTAGAVLPLRIRNTARFLWNPSARNAPKEGLAAEVFASRDEKMIRENTRDARVTLSYRLLGANNELVDEGDHVDVPHDVVMGGSFEMDLAVRPVRYAGPVKLKIDLVHEGVTWFGERGNSAAELDVEIANVPFAAYLSASNRNAVAAAMDRDNGPGTELSLPIRIHNVGTGPIGGASQSDALSCHWKKRDGGYAVWEGAKIAVVEEIAPGEHADLSLPVLVPHDLAAGRYDVEIDLLREGETWLSTCWNRPLLSYPTRIAIGDGARPTQKDAGGRTPVWEPRGQCVANTGNKGIW